MRRKVDVSSHVDDRLRQFLTRINRGLFTKGDLMAARDKAILHYINCEAKLTKNTPTGTNHHDKMAEKQRRIEEEYNIIRGRLLNYLVDNIQGDIPYLKKDEMDKAIMYATGCKARSLDNKRKDLLAHGVIREDNGTYRIIDTGGSELSTRKISY